MVSSFRREQNDSCIMRKLRSELMRASSNTDVMLGKLQSFKGQLESMEAELKPLQESTANFIIAKEKINKTLVEMGKTHEYFQVTNGVKGIAYQGFSSSRATDFLAAIDRLTKAKDFFEVNQEMRGADSLLADINQLLAILVGSCVKEISTLFEKVGPGVIIVEEGDGKIKARDTMPDDLIQSMHLLIGMLVKIKSKEHLLMYKRNRSKSISQQLDFFDDLKQSDWKALSDPCADTSGGYRIATDNCRQKVFHQYLHFGLELLRGEVFLWSALLSQTGPGSMDVFVALCMEFVKRLKEIVSPYLSSENIGSRSRHDKCLIRLELASSFMEYFDNLYEVCKPDFRKDSAASIALMDLRTDVYKSAVNGLQYLVDTSKDPGPGLSPEESHSSISSGEKGGASTAKGGDTDAETGVFSVGTAGKVCSLQLVVTQTLHCCKELMSADNVVASLMQICQGSHESVPAHASSTVRSVPDLVMTLLQSQLNSIVQKGELIAAAVSVIASRSLQSKEASAFSRDTFIGGGIGVGLETPIKDRSSTVDLSLTGRGSLFNPKVHLDSAKSTHLLFTQLEHGSEESVIAMMEACQYLYLSNNLYHVHSFVVEAQDQLEACLNGNARSNDSGNVYDKPRFLTMYYEEVRESLAHSKLMFCRTVAKNMGMSAIDEEDFNTRYASTPSSDKQSRGRLVKGKFALFNQGIEALLSQQGAWKVSAPALRDELGISIADAVYPYYRAFYQEYHGTNFSKRHMDQYVKFTPEDVKILLLRFFSGNIK